MFIAPTVPGDSPFAPGDTLPVVLPSTFELVSLDDPDMFVVVPTLHGAANETLVVTAIIAVAATIFKILDMLPPGVQF
ncbi:hypothetical protein [Methylobacterium sp. E-046]|uniref:hypothetical protein n=1 Tax=Methylobacterium sp. E-046 TaxID=2836576 RepID=UPI001FB8D8AD|nr:hypothetical protein [Methylobacterium sp. E-046]MCJ2101842.1 hypothetical protein [Methylobacterium sp. E-046]